MDYDRTDVIFHNPHNGRAWTANTIDEFVVGRIHGRYSMDQICLYITYNNMSLANITVDELERFWNNTLMMVKDTPQITFWSTKTREDEMVQRVLQRITNLLMQVTTILE